MEAMLLGAGGWVPTGVRETACLYVRHGPRVLVLDAGTGLRRLLTSQELVNGVARMDVCISHFHLDHVIGLSYLPGVPREVELVVWGPGRSLYDTTTLDVLERMISPPLFGLSLRQFVPSVRELPLGELDIGPFAVGVRRQDRHPQPSLAFRVSDLLAYCTDTGYDAHNAPFAAGCRYLLHEAFYAEETDDKGHSTPAQAARIALEARVSDLTLVHLNPFLARADEGSLIARAQPIFPSTQVGRDLAVFT